MKTEQRPWGVHHIGDVYHPDVQCVLPDGRWVAAVAEPYSANSIVAAWWVLTGRAYAMVWPKPGELENVWQRVPAPAAPQPSRPFVPVTIPGNPPAK
jgi:hypothetical protein